MIRTDSRKVQPGDTFVALDGISSNGSQYIGSAIANGAVKIICREGSYPVETENADDPRARLEELLVSEYGDIVSNMTLIGVTGTNGKTTTCFLVSQALNALEIKCAYIGTIGFYMDEFIRPLPNTSVDICELYSLLLEAHENGFDCVALEASSQGLDMGRLNTIKFDVAAFTNLTEDHLDYHKNMDNYASAKRILFDALKPDGVAVLNRDDPYYERFINKDHEFLTYGFGEGCDLQVIRFGGDERTEFIYRAGPRCYRVFTELLGRHNMYNLAATLTILAGLGLAAEEAAGAVEGAAAPDGRMDRIRFNNNNIVIDYAHTPDAVEQIIKTARTFTKNNIYVVFGCTGDREREKRPVMTKIVLENAAYAVITVDDIHGEDPERIFADMLEGNMYDNYEVCPDRREAIKKGIERLQEGDSLLILGKGHEKFIAKDGGNIPHNDKQAVLEITGLE